MYRCAAALLHDGDLARDIVHDVFASLLDGGPGITVSSGYLLAAVRNRSLNYIRDTDIHRRIAGLYFLDNEEYDAEEWPDEETISRIYTLMSNDVSPQARRVMELRFFRRDAILPNCSDHGNKRDRRIPSYEQRTDNHPQKTQSKWISTILCLI